VKLDKCLKPSIESFVESTASLYLNAVSSVANETIIVSLRMLDNTSGAIRPVTKEIVVQTGDLVVEENMQESIILSASLSSSLATVRGQTFAALKIKTRDGRFLRTFIAGYLTNTQAKAYPPVYLEDSISGYGYPKKVAGAIDVPLFNVLYLVPANRVWKLKGLVAAVWTDANPADRQVYCNTSDGVGNFLFFPSSKKITAAQIWRYVWNVGTTFVDASGDTIKLVQSPITEQLLFPNAKVYVQIANQQAGDQFVPSANWINVEEYLLLS
jgi:hypothetical protein